MLQPSEMTNSFQDFFHTETLFAKVAKLKAMPMIKTTIRKKKKKQRP